MRLKIDKGFASAFYTSLLCVAIYLLATSIPSFGLVEQSDFTGVLRYVALPFVVVLLYKDGYRLSKHSWTSALLCLPLLLVCFGNLISIGLNSQATIAWNTSSLSRDFVYTLGTAVTEEVVFRFGLLEALKRTSAKKCAILISSLVFGVCHLGGLLGGASIGPTLMQGGYTFALGLLWGAAYEIGGLLPAIVLHFCFNFFQNDIYLSVGGGAWNWQFFAFNIGFYVLDALYAIFLLLRLHKFLPQKVAGSNDDKVGE